MWNAIGNKVKVGSSVAGLITLILTYGPELLPALGVSGPVAAAIITIVTALAGWLVPETAATKARMR